MRDAVGWIPSHWEGTFMTQSRLDQAVSGVMQVEQRLLALAGERDVHGFKIEWNEGLDFGHLMDPVHVALLTDSGRVEGQFRLSDVTASGSAEQEAVRAEIDRLVSALEKMPHQGPPLHEPPGAP
jgi:hypothetical protein